MGFSINPNAQLTTEQQTNFTADLASQLPFDIYVTSGTRNARQQAQAMFTKIELGDNLIAIYKDDSFAQGVMDAYPSIANATGFIQQYYDTGRGSKHGRGLAIDIRTRNLSSDQILQLIAAAKNIGGSTLLEQIPPHLHIGIPADYAASSKKNILKILIPLTLLSIFAVQFMGKK